MPRIAGVYSLPAGNPIAFGSKSSSALFNAALADIATALNGILAADGSVALTGDLSMGSHKITSLATPTVATDAATKAYVDSAASGGSLNASNLTSGTVPDARFPATLPALSGINLTALNASNLGSGTVPDARFPATLPALNGSALTNLNGSNIATGTLALARLPTIPSSQTSGFATVATSASAADLTGGLLASARLSGSYAGITAVGTLTGLSISDTLTMSNGTTLAAGYGATAAFTAGMAGSIHRLFIGDGSGWALKIASRVGSVTTDRFTFSDTGALTVSAGLTVSASGIAVTGNSTITGTLGGLTGLTVASGGAAITGNTSVSGGTFTSRGLTDNSTVSAWTIDSSGRLVNTATQPAVSATRNAVQSGAPANVVWNTKTTDTGSELNTTNGNYVAGAAGWRVVMASVMFSNTSGGALPAQLSITSGGLTWATTDLISIPDATTQQVSIFALVKMAASDTLLINNTGTPLSASFSVPSSTSNRLTIAMLY